MFDLHTALHDAARSGTARRPTLAAGPVLSRIRRRRTARVAAQSTVGIAAAGAVALGAVDLLSTRTTPPAAPTPVSPTPTGGTTEMPDVSCGTVLDDVPRADVDVRVSISMATGGVIHVGDPIQTTIDTAFHVDSGFENRSYQSTLVAVQDGVVVGVGWQSPGEVTNLDSHTEGGWAHFPALWTAPFRACDGSVYAEPWAPLAAGEYEVNAVVSVEVAVGTWAPVISESEDLVLEATQGSAAAPPPLESMTIGLAGLGPLAIGSTVPGSPAPTDLLRWDADFCAGTEVPGRWLANYDDLVDPDGKHWQPFSVSVFEDHVIRINVQVAGPHTAEGIEVGSTLAQLRAAYPGLEQLRSAVDTGIPIDAWGLRDGETTLVFEVSANGDAPDPYWQPDELDRVVAIVLVSGIPYGQESWFSELCG